MSLDLEPLKKSFIFAWTGTANRCFSIPLFLFVFSVFTFIAFSSQKRGSITYANGSKLVYASVRTSPKPTPEVVQKRRLILLWTTFFGNSDFYFGIGQQPFLTFGCAVSNCEVTTDRQLLNSSDAIIFHFRDMSIEDLPRWRLPSQRWIFFLMESPEYTSSEHLALSKGLFNWTMTYRSDSDVVIRYGLVTPKKGSHPDNSAISAAMPQSSTVFNKYANRTKRRLAAWIVSNCWTEGQRETYVNKLSKHLPIDIYGKCADTVGNQNCSEETCGKAVYRSHKFYLSFENSVCRDYVTEKFFNALVHGIVPVVYGGANYSRLAPPHSYLDVRDFSSPAQLAQRLEELDANDTLYDEYLAWTDSWNATTAGSTGRAFCDLCSALHRKEQHEKVYHDMLTWWSVNSSCVHGLNGILDIK